MGSVAVAGFTAAQWEELERQAMIYKHFAAGLPVPHDLLLSLRRVPATSAPTGLQNSSSGPPPYFYHPSLGNFSYYGKKLDPEPGRCRRTDGKKWRCSKDAHPDSKYCERHMHRTRNRSRKPVENKTVPLPKSSTVTMASHSPIESAGNGTGSITTMNQQLSLSHHQGSGPAALNTSLWCTNSGTYRLGNYRQLQGFQTEVNEHSFLLAANKEASAIGSSVSSSWGQMPSDVSSFSFSNLRTSSGLAANYRDFYSPELEQSVSSFCKQQQQQQQKHNSFQGSGYGSQVKQENQPLRPFLDDWPRTRDLWSDMEHDRSTQSSFSTTQLSISIPTATDYTSTSSTPKGSAPLFLGIEH